MGEPINYFEDSHGNRLAWSKFDVLWQGEFRSASRLGSFVGKQIYDNSDQIIATIDGNDIVSKTGEIIGCIERNDSSLFEGKINGVTVGFSQNLQTLAAAIALTNLKPGSGI